MERLRIVREGMGQLKESKQALGAEVISGLQDFAPPTLLAQASRLNFSTRLFNLIVTNVPGPQFPLYMLGREMEEIVPIAFLPENHALAIAIMSYNGKVDFGLLGDYDAMPDLDAFGAPRGLAGRAAGGGAHRKASARSNGARSPAARRGEEDEARPEAQTTRRSRGARAAASRSRRPPTRRRRPVRPRLRAAERHAFCPTARDAQRVPSFDGVPLDVDLTLPALGDGPFPRS